MRPEKARRPGLRRRRFRLGAALLITALLLAACGDVDNGDGSGRSGEGLADPAAPLPEARTEVAGAYWADEDLIAVAGGFREADDGLAPTSALDLFDLETGRWSRGPDLPGEYHHASLAVLDGRLYLVGGNRDGVTTDEVWRLDSPEGEWMPQPPLPTPREALATVAVSGRLVAIGGAGGGSPLRVTEVFDPGADGGRGEWTRGPDLAIGREHTAAAVVDDTVYAIAGRPPNLASVESLVVPGGEWEPEPDLNFSRGGNAAATVDGVPCVAGGEEEAGTIGSIECLLDGQWEHVSDLAVARHGLAAVADDGRIHFIGGGPTPGASFSGTHEIFAL